MPSSVLVAARRDGDGGHRGLAARLTAGAARVHAMPRGVELGLLGVVSVLAAVGLVSLGQFNILPATTVLDVAFYGTAVAMATWIDRRMLPLGLVIAGVLVVRMVVVFTEGEASLEATIQSHKWVLNLLVLLLCSGRVARIPDLATRLAWVLVPAAVVKYAVDVVVVGNDRPGLLYENNFELALLCGLVAVSLRHSERGRVALMWLLAVATILGGSRSGSIAFAVTALYAVHVLIGRWVVRYYIAAVTGVAVIAAAAMLFEARYRNEGQVDRLNFAEIFAKEVEGFGVLEWAIGAPPMSPLSQDACDRLGYYERLIEDTATSECYAVVLHAFILRVLFNFGILGLIVAFAVPAYLMLRNRVAPGVVLVLTLISLSNAASVSGLNNVYIALPIMLAILQSAGRDAGPPGTHPPPAAKSVPRAAHRWTRVGPTHSTVRRGGE